MCFTRCPVHRVFGLRAAVMGTPGPASPRPSHLAAVWVIRGRVRARDGTLFPAGRRLGLHRQGSWEAINQMRGSALGRVSCASCGRVPKGQGLTADAIWPVVWIRIAEPD